MPSVAELAATVHELLTRTVLKVRGAETHCSFSGGGVDTDALQAVLLLLAMALLPALVRVRILYTFCWAGFTVLAHVVDSEAALGMATSLGLSIMLGWYSLRALDRSTFHGILQGWFGFLSAYQPFRLLCNSVDLVLHMGVPLALALCYLPLVRLWMTLPILLFSQCWIRLVAGGDLYPGGNQVYHFYPPRPKEFWSAARRIELFYSLTTPLACVLLDRLGVHEFIVNGLLRPAM